MNPAQREVKTLSDIFVPLIPALVASGLMMGLFNLLTQPGFGRDSAMMRTCSASGRRSLARPR